MILKLDLQVDTVIFVKFWSVETTHQKGFPPRIRPSDKLFLHSKIFLRQGGYVLPEYDPARLGCEKESMGCLKWPKITKQESIWL